MAVRRVNRCLGTRGWHGCPGLLGLLGHLRGPRSRPRLLCWRRACLPRGSRTRLGWLGECRAGLRLRRELEIRPVRCGGATAQSGNKLASRALAQTGSWDSRRPTWSSGDPELPPVQGQRGARCPAGAALDWPGSGSAGSSRVVGKRGSRGIRWCPGLRPRPATGSSGRPTRPSGRSTARDGAGPPRGPLG